MTENPIVEHILPHSNGGDQRPLHPDRGVSVDGDRRDTALILDYQPAPPPPLRYRAMTWLERLVLLLFILLIFGILVNLVVPRDF